MILFGVASAGCAAAPDVWVLVAARIVQAAGGALLMPASLGLLLAAAPPERRVATIRSWTSVGGAAAALGPVVGGALVAASWHWVFLVNVPIVAIAVVAGARVLPVIKPSTSPQATANIAAEEAEALPDILGAVAFTVAVSATAANVIFGISFGAMLLLVTLWCQDVWHWSALQTGLAVAPGRCSSRSGPSRRDRSPAGSGLARSPLSAAPSTRRAASSGG